MIGYRSRIEKDMGRWQQRGWLTAEGAAAIRADLDARGRRFGLAQILGMLGAVLLCFAAMTFVASNWEAMSKGARLALLLAGLWGSYGAAYHLLQREMPAFGHAAILVGVGIFGAAIMLIAQMYHMEGNPPDAVLLWAAGAVLAAVALRSNPAMAAAIALVLLWSVWEAAEREAVHWMFLPAWAGLGALVLATTRWRPALHLLALGLGGWVLLLGGLLNVPEASFHVSLLLGLALAAVAAVAGPALDRLLGEGAPLSKPLVAYALATSYGALWALQFLDRKHLGVPLVVLYVGALLLTLAAIAYALRADNRPLLWLSYAAFSMEIVSIYFKTIGSLIGTSLFFLTAGLLVIALAWIAWRLHARNSPAQGAVS